MAQLSKAGLNTRNAVLRDVAHIHSIMEPYYFDRTLLRRQIPELCENIRDFVVAEHDGEIVGCGALHLYGIHLAEIRSLAVRGTAQRLGTGSLLATALLKEAERHQVACVCLFTRIPQFFARLGFTRALRENFPDKIHKDCLHCPSLHACNEVAMVRGNFQTSVAENAVQFVSLS